MAYGEKTSSCDPLNDYQKVGISFSTFKPADIEIQ